MTDISYCTPSIVIIVIIPLVDIIIGIVHQAPQPKQQKTVDVAASPQYLLGKGIER